jgi:hypothetical protein
VIDFLWRILYRYAFSRASLAKTSKTRLVVRSLQGVMMSIDLASTVGTKQEVRAAEIVFATLPSLGMDRMTAGGVEFVMCASALTAQV